MSWEIDDSLTGTPGSKKLHVPQQKPYISPSQINSYTRCPEAYRRRYLQREIIPPGLAMLKGTSVHRGAEHNFKQKIETREDLKRKEIVDFAVSAFETEIEASGVYLNPEEESIGKDKVVGQAKDTTVKFAEVLADQVVPAYQPVAVEQKVCLELPSSSHNLLSIADMVDDKGQVVELKTGKRWNQEMADTNVQITFQAATFKALHQKTPNQIVVENIVDNKTAIRNPVYTQRSDEDFEAMINRINAVLDGINKSSFPPANDGAWWCSKNFCGYWSTCCYVKRKR